MIMSVYVSGVSIQSAPRDRPLGCVFYGTRRQEYFSGNLHMCIVYVPAPEQIPVYVAVGEVSRQAHERGAQLGTSHHRKSDHPA